MLLKQQTNELNRRLRDAGLDMSRVGFDKATDKPVGVVQYSGPGIPKDWLFTFAYHSTGNTWRVTYKPSAQSRPRLILNWEGVLELAAEWARIIKSETEDPDLWEIASALASPPLNMADERFTEPELKQLETHLGEVRRQLAAAPGVKPEEKRIVDEIIAEHGVEDSKRLDKKDWMNAFLGALVSKMLDRVIEPTTLQFVWMLIVETVVRLFGP
jgi:hypothetical protein